MTIGVLAQPWWVNLLVLIPFIAFFMWRRGGHSLTAQQLLISAIFATCFGFVEAAVVVYLRAAIGLLPGYQSSLADVARLSGDLYKQAQAVTQIPESLLTVEVFREAAAIFVLLSVALLAASSIRARWAIFLWTFAIWDLVYYAGLWITVRWPTSLRNPDVLFLIPVPWLAQVWFPLLVSGLTLVAVALAKLTSTEV